MYTLTPADKWHSNKKVGSSFSEHEDQLMEHEHSFCSHDHHSHQCKVVDQNWHKHTGSIYSCLVNTTHKDKQHTKQGYAELNVKYCGIALTKFPVYSRKLRCQIWQWTKQSHVTSSELNSLEQKQGEKGGNKPNQRKDHTNNSECLQHSFKCNRWLTVLKSWTDVLDCR